MGDKVKVAGTWRDITMPYTRVAGVWKPAKAVYNKVAGKWYSSFLQGGINDYGFTDYDIASRANSTVGSGSIGDPGIVVQSDGKIIVGGNFTTWNGATVGYIVRLNSDGTRDTTFTTNTGTGAAGSIYALAVQSDGKILIVGNFTTWNAVTVGYIVRLNADGTRDTTFTTNTGTGAAVPIYAVVVQSDGKIVLGGAFTTWNGTTVNRIVRLNSDGTRDTVFTTNTGTAASVGNIYALAVQPSDGKIILGGNVTTWNGVAVNRIVRLNTDGTRDTAFTTNTGTGAAGAIYVIKIQSDSKILLGGGFTSWNGATVGYIVRLNSDGTRDTTFTTNNGTGANGIIYTLSIQSDGKILIGGVFTAWNGTTANTTTRIASNGALDTTFATNIGTGGGATYTAFAIAVQSDGKIIVGGTFTTWTNVTVNRIVRLNSDGTMPISGAIDGSIAIAPNGYTGYPNGGPGFAVQSDGKIIVGGGFTAWSGVGVNRIVRLNSDGTRDTAFSTNIGTGPNSFVQAVAIQSDGKIIVGGAFTTWNGATVGYIVRLNTDGTRDTTFTTNTGTGAGSAVYSIAIQSDGKIILGGAFTTWNGITTNRVVRLNADGTKDTAYSTNNGTAYSGGAITGIAIQTNGSAVFVGNTGATTSTWNGTSVYQIFRLNSAGTIDTTFSTNVGTAGGATIALSALAIQSDGKIIVGGSFSAWNAVASINRLVRLNSDGTRDTTFTTNNGAGANSNPNDIVVQSDGKILLGGAFTAWNGTTVNYIVRLNSDGTRDTAFTTNAGTGANAIIYTLVIQSDNKVLVGGNFTGYNSINRSYLARIGGEIAI